MSITSAQENIMQDIVTTLQNIDGATYYNLDLGSRVYRMYIDPTAIGNFPYAVVFDEYDCTITPLTANELTVGDDQLDVTSGWPILIVGYVSANRDTDREGLLQQDLIKMESDIIIAMAVDRTRGGYALSTVPVMRSKIVDWENNFGGVGIKYIIKYKFNPSIPTT